jgi:hypothetical protein
VSSVSYDTLWNSLFMPLRSIFHLRIFSRNLSRLQHGTNTRYFTIRLDIRSHRPACKPRLLSFIFSLVHWRTCRMIKGPSKFYLVFFLYHVILSTIFSTKAPEKSLRGPEQFMMNRKDMQICFYSLTKKEGE